RARSGLRASRFRFHHPAEVRRALKIVDFERRSDPLDEPAQHLARPDFIDTFAAQLLELSNSFLPANGRDSLPYEQILHAFRIAVNLRFDITDDRGRKRLDWDVCENVL